MWWNLSFIDKSEWVSCSHEPKPIQCIFSELWLPQICSVAECNFILLFSKLFSFVLGSFIFSIIRTIQPSPHKSGQSRFDCTMLECFAFYVFCSIDSSWCEGPSPCFNGNCTDVGDNYTCACLPGYTGQRCETGEKHSCQDYRCKVLFARANFSNNDLLKIFILPICNNFSVIWLKLRSVSNAS